LSLEEVRSVLLVVDAENPTGATALYKSVGMSVAKRFDVWERTLDRSWQRTRETLAGGEAAETGRGGSPSRARLA